MFETRQYRVTGIAFLLCSILVSGGAQAQPSDEPTGERAAAEVMFEAGRSAMAAGDYDEACEKFEASMELDAAPGTLLNLGNCEEKRGRVASAWERYVAAQRELPETDRRREFAAKKAKQLAGSVPRLTISLAADAPSDTKVRRTDIDLTGSIGVALPVDPGSYTIEVTAKGYEPRSFEIDIALGEERALEVWPGDALPEPPPTPPRASGPEAEPIQWGPLTKRQWGYIAGGVGIAGVVTALTTGSIAYGKKQTMADHCDSDERICNPIGIEAKQDGATLTTVADISALVGITALGTGVYLVLTGDRVLSSDTPGDKAQAGSSTPLVEVGTFPGFHGLRFTSQFQ